MLSSGRRCFMRGAALVFISASMFPGLAIAQTSPTVAQFLANPTQVMAQFQAGGATFISLIRDVAVSNPSALQTIIGLVSGANPDQRAAIGSGLGQAYNIVIKTDQVYAAQIAAAAVGSAAEVQTAYASATGNSSITSTGGGGGDAGGGSGGTTGAGTGSGGAPSGGSNTGTTTTSSTTTTTSTQTFTGGGGGTTSSGSVSVY